MTRSTERRVHKQHHWERRAMVAGEAGQCGQKWWHPRCISRPRHRDVPRLSRGGVRPSA